MGVVGWGAFWVVVTAVVAGLGAALVDRFHPAEKRCENNDVAGMMFSIIGVVYAILLTFVTIAVWEASAEADDSSRAEARAVVDLDRFAAAVGGEPGMELHELARRYAYAVVHDEWPKLASGLDVPPAGQDLVDRMWSTVDAIKPVDDAQIARQSEARTDLRTLVEARSTRLANADDGLPLVIWSALIISAVMAVINAIMFGVHGRTFYVSMVAILAALSALLLFTVYQLEYPYQRGERVTVEGFTAIAGGLLA